MVFQDFSKNYLNILMVPLCEQLLYHNFLYEPVIFCLNLNEALLPGKYQEHQLQSKLVHLFSIATIFLMFSNDYCYILLNYTLALIHQFL